MIGKGVSIPRMWGKSCGDIERHQRRGQNLLILPPASSPTVVFVVN